MFLLPRSVLVFLRATRKKVEFCCHVFVQSRVKLKTEESSTACVNVYKLLRRELKECCYSLLKMIMVINARVCIFFCYFCALSSSLLRSAFPFLMHFDEIRVLVSHQNASKREKRSEGERKKERRNSRRIYTHAH